MNQGAGVGALSCRVASGHPQPCGELLWTFLLTGGAAKTACYSHGRSLSRSDHSLRSHWLSVTVVPSFIFGGCAPLLSLLRLSVCETPGLDLGGCQLGSLLNPALSSRSPQRRHPRTASPSIMALHEAEALLSAGSRGTRAGKEDLGEQVGLAHL